MENKTKISYALIMYNIGEVIEYGAMCKYRVDGNDNVFPVIGQWFEGNIDELCEHICTQLRKTYEELNGG